MYHHHSQFMSLTIKVYIEKVSILDNVNIPLIYACGVFYRSIP